MSLYRIDIRTDDETVDGDEVREAIVFAGAEITSALEGLDVPSFSVEVFERLNDGQRALEAWVDDGDATRDEP